MKVERPVGRRTRLDRGAVIPLVAMSLSVLVLMTAFAVDLGRQRVLRRDLQADADVIALDLVRLIGDVSVTEDGVPTLDELHGPAGSVTLEALNEALARNGKGAVSGYTDLEAHGALVEWGSWVEEACGPAPASEGSCFFPGSTPINAVRVTFRDDVEYHFQPGSGSATRSAVATTGEDPMVGMTLGSFAARIDSGRGVLLPMLSELLGVDADLDALGYAGIASSAVGLGPLLTELEVGSADQVAEASVTFDDLYRATLAALDADDPEDAATVALMEALIDDDAQIPDLGVPHQAFALADLFAFASGTDAAAFGGAVNVFDLLTAGAQLANGENAATVDGIGVAVPGVAGATATVSLIEAPQVVFGGVGAAGSTAQMRAAFDLEALSGLLSGVSVSDIVLEVEAAGANTQITSICDPSLVAAGSDAHAFSAVTQTDLVSVKLTVGVSIPLFLLPDVEVDVIFESPAPPSEDGSPPGESSTFTWTDPAPGQSFSPVYDEVGQDDLGLDATSFRFEPTSGLSGAVTSLLSPIVGQITSTLVPAVNDVLNPLVSALGINLTGADLAPFYGSCEGLGVSLVE